MQYINYLIQFIIYINILFTLIIIARYLMAKLARASSYSNIKQYQITNWYITIFCVIFYICILLVGLYCLRLYNLNRELDLKILYHNISNIILIIWNISDIYTILGLILVIFIIIDALLIMVLTYKLIINQLYNLYLFIRFNSHDRNYFSDLIYHNLKDYYDRDLISFWLQRLSHYLNCRLGFYKMNLIWEKNPDIFSPEYDKKLDIFSQYNKNRSWYNFDVIICKVMGNKYYDKIFIPFSPLLIILYDCVFNDLVITHVYYYLLIYIPVILFRKFTILVSTENKNIGKLIWDILYKRETCIYALPKDYKKLFDIYIANGIRTIDLGPPALMDLDASTFINWNAKFVFDEKEKLYYNGGDRSLEFLEDGRLVYRHIDYDTREEVDEEWYLIAKKYHYENNGKYETIIYID